MCTESFGSVMLMPVWCCVLVVVGCVCQAREPFRVYIVIPMYPEGIPTSASVQAILYYQAKTRQMMYKCVV